MKAQGLIPYKSRVGKYYWVAQQRVGFLRRFDLKTGIHIAHICLESVDMVFEGCTGIKRIYRFSSK